VLLAPDIIDEKYGRVISATQLRNGLRREQHEFDRCPRGKHWHNYDFGEIQPTVACGSAHVQPCANILNYSLPVAMTPAEMTAPAGPTVPPAKDRN
jgi:hypothetical protein